MSTHEQSVRINSQLAEQLADVLRVFRSVSSTLDVQEVYEASCKAAVQLLGVSHSGLALFDSTLDYATVVAEHPNTLGVVGLKLPIKGIPAEEDLVHNLNPIVMQNVSADTSLGSVRDVLLSRGITAILIVPIVRNNRVLGSFSLDCIGTAKIFTAFEIELCNSLAAQVAIAIENAGLFAQQERRAELHSRLSRLSKNLKTSRDPKDRAFDIVRLSTELVDGSDAELYVNYVNTSQLQVISTYPFDGLKIGTWRPHSDVLVGEAARWGIPSQVLPSDDNNLIRRRTISTPLYSPDGEISHILLVRIDDLDGSAASLRAEVLHSFAMLASVAIHSTTVPRAESHHNLLHALRDYLDSEVNVANICSAVLTSITAGYGLGFNRALMFTVDETRSSATCILGIGQNNEMEAVEAWNVISASGPNNFAEYLEQPGRGNISLTAMGALASQLRVTLDPDMKDPLSRVALSGEWMLVQQNLLDTLPAPLRTALDPTTPVVMVPVASGGEVIGVVIADCKFARYSIFPEHCELLMKFASVAASAISRLRSVERIRLDKDRFQSLYHISSRLLEGEPEDTDATIFHLMRDLPTFSTAEKAVAVFVDKTGKPVEVHSNEPILAATVSVDEIAATVLRDRQPLVADFSLREPVPGLDGGSCGLCLPLILHGRAVGFIWLVYSAVHRFTEEEIATLRSYANQIALAYGAAVKSERLESLTKAVKKLSAAVDPAEVMTELARGAHDIFDAHRACVYPCDPVSGELQITRAVMYPVAPVHQAEGTPHILQANPLMVSNDIKIIKMNTIQAGALPSPLEHAFRLSSVAEVHVVPILDREEHLAALYLGHLHPDATFTVDELRTLDTLTAHAALALKRASLIAELERLNEAAQIVARSSAAGEYQHTLEFVTESIRKAAACDVVVLYRYDYHRNAIESPATIVGLTDEPVDIDESVAPGALVHAMLQRDSALLVTDVAGDPLFSQSQFARREAIRSCGVFPLVFRGQKVGVTFVNYRSLHSFSDSEYHNIELFANQAAVAIRNAQLYAQLETTYLELKTTDDVKTEYLHSVSHGLRTPLTPLKYSLEELLAGTFGWLSQAQLTCIKDAIDNVNEEMRLIDNLLDVARISAGKLNLNRELCGVSDLVVKVVRTFDYLAGNKEIDLKSLVPIDDPLITFADRDKVSQIVTNLLGNAVKFTPSHGEVVVIATRENECIHISVKDNGPGIRQEDLDRIFDRFFQGDAEIDNKQGLGIGLDLVRRFVALHDGTITVTSNFGHGSTFDVYLPIRAESGL